MNNKFAYKQESASSDIQKPDYADILLNSFDTVVSARLDNLPFDKTIVCTITDDSKKAQGCYTVSDGSITFEAYSDKADYAVNHQVYVVIPQNNMSQNKQIIGRYITDINSDPIAYVTPLDKVIPLTDANLASASNMAGAIEANGDTIIVPIGAISDLSYDVQVYDTLAIKANFRTRLENIPLVSGSYGLLIQVITQDVTVNLHLDSAQDMFGNVYGYTVPMLQQQAYKLSEAIGTINEIKWSLYQRQDFTYINDNGETVKLNPIGVNNIEISDIEIYLGSDVSEVDNYTVKIYTNDALTYANEITAHKKVNLLWYNKTPENKLIGFSDGRFDKEKAKDATKIPDGDEGIYYWIDWLVDNNNGSLEIIDVLGDAQETEIPKKLQNVEIACRLELPITEVSAKVWRNGLAYPANPAEAVIAFKNQTSLESDKMSFMGIQLSIEHGENSKDAYPIYGEWGGVINTADAYHQRSVHVAWSSEKAEIKDAFWNGATITWRVPEACMLLPVDTDLPIIDNFYVDEKTLVIDENGALNAEDLMFNYRIREIYNTAYVNNIIKCEISLKGEKVETKKSFNFAAHGTYGTDYTIIIKPTQDRIFVPFNSDTTLEKDFIAELYEDSGEKVDGAKIDLSLVKGNSFTIENYNVIKGQTKVPWGGKQVVLETLYPVLYSQEERYYAEAPTRVLYNSFGVLMNLNSGRELKLFYLTDFIDNSNITHKAGSQVQNVTWLIEPDYTRKAYGENEISRQRLAKLMPYIESNDTAQTLTIPNSYINTGKPQYLIAKNSDGTILWTSPLIIQQYRYESEILNNWDGALTIDDGNNMVLAGAGVFGKKNNDNSFSGVALGKLKHINSGVTETGVLGFHHGAQSYGFRDDGTAFIGQSGTGRIHFDGNQGIIASASWDNGSLPSNMSGTKINLKEASLLLDTQNGQYLYFNKNNSGNLELKLNAANITLVDKDNTTLGGYITATAEKIAAKVENKQTDKAFGWDLNSDSFTLSSTINNQKTDVFRCDATGLNITGNITMTGGVITWANKDNNNIGVPRPSYDHTEISGLDDYLEDFQSQLDGRAETWYQDTDPSDSWTDDATKEAHLGDLWHCTAEIKTNNKIERYKNSEWIWRKTANGIYQWEAIEVSDEVFDAIDKKRQIFVEQPEPPYDIGDLWVQGQNGEILRCAKERVATESFNEADWISASKYTDDSSLVTFINGEYAENLSTINTQLDKKAETWYQDTEPSDDWKDEATKQNHIGDLWYNTKVNKSYTYNGTTWVESDVPQEVYDKIDGRSTIYTEKPVSAREKDLLIPAQDHEGYKVGKVYRYNGTNWVEINYTDEARVNALINNVKSELQTISLNSVKELDKTLANYFNLTGANAETIIGGNRIISPYIGGGYLHIAGNYGSVTINPTYNNGTTQTVFEIKNAKQNTVIGFNSDGDAFFDGVITAKGGYIGNITIADGGLKKTNTWTVIESYGYYNPLESHQQYKYGISSVATSPFVVSANSAYYKHHYTIPRGTNKNIKIISAYNGASGYLMESVPVTEEGAVIEGNHTYLRRYVSISGSIIPATDLIGLGINDKDLYLLITDTDKENLPLFAENTDNIITTKSEDTFTITSEGKLICNQVQINGTITAGKGSKIGPFKVDGNSIYIGSWSGGSPDVFMCSGSQYSYEIAGIDQAGWVFGAGENFGVDKSGNLYASGGKIGPLNITSNGLGVSNISSSGTPSSTYLSSSSIQSSKITCSQMFFDSIGIQAYQDNSTSNSRIWIEASSYSNVQDEYYAISIGSLGIELWRAEGSGKFAKLRTMNWYQFFN